MHVFWRDIWKTCLRQLSPEARLRGNTQRDVFSFSPLYHFFQMSAQKKIYLQSSEEAFLNLVVSYIIVSGKNIAPEKKHYPELAQTEEEEKYLPSEAKLRFNEYVFISPGPNRDILTLMIYPRATRDIRKREKEVWKKTKQNFSRLHGTSREKKRKEKGTRAARRVLTLPESQQYGSSFTFFPFTLPLCRTPTPYSFCLPPFRSHGWDLHSQHFLSPDSLITF
ncbi:hypothetical protein CEXT_12241 [Caerostris extrusa]|uniref:Uncharacterized protein n=1 Tax=Caerostris extrusa TaxID=172846 RepID=A0AAV4SFF7_CAEEX|nr:hypothetical protein CEXT_12241 [Caerostris extrusa]